MLNTLRRAAKSWLAIGFLLLLGLAVAMTGGFDVFRAGAGGDVAVVGSQRLSVPEMERAWSNALRNLRRQNPDQPLTDTRARESGLPNQIFSQFVSRMRYRQEAESLGLVTTDQEIIRAMAQIEGLVDPVSGVVDPGEVRNILARNDISEEDFTEEIADSLRRQKFAAFVTAGVTPPAFFADIQRTAALEERIVSAVLITPSELPISTIFDEAELQALYDENTLRLQTPEYRAVDIALVRPNLELAAEGISDALIEDALATELAAQTTAETRSLRELPASDRETAQVIADRLRGGEDADAIAASLNLIGVNTYGDVTRAELFDAALADAAFTVEPGGVSEPIETSLSWSVVIVDGVTPAQAPDPEIVRTQVIGQLAEARAQTAAAAQGRSFERALREGASLQDAAEAAELAFFSIEAVDRSGRDPEGETVPALSGLPDALERTFQRDPGLMTPLLTAADGSQFALQVRGIRPPETRPFEDVRDDLERDLLSQRRDAALAEMLAQMREALTAGQSHVEVAALAGDAGRTDLFTVSRFTPPPVVDAASINSVFAADVGLGDVVSARGAAGEATLLRVEAILPEEASSDAFPAELFAGSVANTVRQDLLELHELALAKEYPVRSSQQNLNRAVGAVSP